jgi:hypothetical protein
MYLYVHMKGQRERSRPVGRCRMLSAVLCTCYSLEFVYPVHLILNLVCRYSELEHINISHMTRV